jgi:hypothetical protein
VTDREITALLDQLVEDVEDEEGDWDDVLRRADAAPKKRPGQRWAVAVGFAAAAIAALVLAETTPWRGGPTLVDRAAAAILAPTSGQILSEQIVFRARIWHPYLETTHAQIYIDGGPVHRFRVTLSGGLRAEIGGKVGGSSGLAYDFTGHVLDPVGFQLTMTRAVLDPTALIRQALTAGRARVEGRARIRGLDVLRIRLSWPAFGRLIPVAYYYVDARHYRPVRIEVIPERPQGYSLGFPLSAAYSFLPTGLRWPGSVYDFVEYRLLGPTAANERLTDIRAQHPHAPIV